MTIWQLDLTLLEPLCLAARPGVGNQTETLDTVSAVALRGALAASLSRASQGGLLESLFSAGPNAPRYLGALPLCPDGHLAIPSPAAYLQNKGDAGLQGQDGCWNALFSKPPDRIGDRTCQWKRCSAPWLLLDPDSLALDHFSVKLLRTTHTGLHYARRAHRESALYSRTELPAGFACRAWIADPQDLWRDELQFARLYIGKRRGAGLGAVELTWTDIPHLPFSWDGTPVAEICVQLLSPAVVPSPGGAWLRGLSSEDWTRLLGVDVTVLQGRSSSSLLQGWSGQWGLPREAASAIAPGSCWRLSVSQHNAAAFCSALATLQSQGLGLRRAEGFGWLAVDPPWLTQGQTCAIRAAGRPAGGPATPAQVAGLLPWPGVPASPSILHSQAGLALAFAHSLRSRLTSPPDLARERVERLLAVARRAKSVPDILAFISAMSARANKHAWDNVSEALSSSGALDALQPEDLPLARFTLEAALASFPLEAES